MRLRIDDSDSVTTQRLKLIYIIPFLFVILIPATLWYGVKEMLEEIPELAREIYDIARGQ